MKRPTKQLADDLLEDSESSEFRVALMDKTLQSVRRRKRARHFSGALGVIAFVGILAFAFHEMREPGALPTQIRQPVSSMTASPSLNPVQVVSSRLVSPLAIVQTSEADRPKEINDKELLALLADKAVALVRSDGRTELISFNQNN